MSTPLEKIKPSETLYWMMQLIAHGYTPREAREIVDDAIGKYKLDKGESE